MGLDFARDMNRRDSGSGLYYERERERELELYDIKENSRRDTHNTPSNLTTHVEYV